MYSSLASDQILNKEPDQIYDKCVKIVKEEEKQSKRKRTL